MLRQLVIPLLIFTTIKAFGVEFLIHHKTCQINGIISKRSQNPPLFEMLESQLQLRNYNMTYVSPKHTFKKGDLILSLEQDFLGSGFFPPCYVKIEIKEEGSEKAFFKGATKRSLPRHFPSGNYRCELAIRDILYHLPHCRLLKNY